MYDLSLVTFKPDDFLLQLTEAKLMRFCTYDTADKVLLMLGRNWPKLYFLPLFKILCKQAIFVWGFLPSTNFEKMPLSADLWRPKPCYALFTLGPICFLPLAVDGPEVEKRREEEKKPKEKDRIGKLHPFLSQWIFQVRSNPDLWLR